MSTKSITTSRSFRVVLLAFGQGLSGIIDLALMAILVRIFIKTDYAIYIQSLLVFKTVSPILVLGLPTTMYLVLPRAKAIQRTRAVLLENQTILLGLGLAFAIFLWLGGRDFIASSLKNEGLAIALNYLAVYIIFSLPLLSLDGVLLANGKAIQIPVFRITSQVFRVVSVLLLSLIFRVPEAAVLGLAMSSVVLYGAGFSLMWRSCDNDSWKPTRASIASQLLLGLPLLLATSFGTLQYNLDTWLVSILSTPEKLAVFAVGATELPLIGLFTAAVTQVLLADCSKMFQEKRLDEIAQVLWQATRSNVILLLPTMIFFFVTAHSVVPLLYSDAYQESIYPFTLYLLVIPARFMNYSGIEVASGKTYLVPIVFGLNIVLTAVLTIVMYPTFGYIAATYSYVAVTYLFAVPAHLLIFTRVLEIPLWSTFPTRQFTRIGVAVGTASLVLLVDPWLTTNNLLRVLILGLLYGTALLATFRIFQVQIPLISAFSGFWSHRFAKATGSA